MYASTIRLCLSAGLVALSLLFTAPASAAESSDIAILNFNQITRDAAAAKAAGEQITAKEKEYQARLNKKEEELQGAEKELRKQKALLAQDAFQKKSEEYRKQVTDAQREYETMRQTIGLSKQQATVQLQKAVMKIAGELAKEKGYKLVLAADTVVYADSAMDITQTVMDRLNKELPKISLDFSKAK